MSQQADDAGQPGETELVLVCSLCGSSQATAVVATTDRLHRIPGHFTLVRCAGCGLLRLSPRPSATALQRYYPPDYAPYRLPDPEAAPEKSLKLRRAVLAELGYGDLPAPLALRLLPHWALARIERRALYGRNDIPPATPGGRALDVGCGDATFLSRLSVLGWDVTGVDFSPSAVEAAKQHYQIEVHLGELQGAQLAPESFDYIHLSHVLEHVTDPVDFLRSVNRLLKPSGLLYIETPNAASLGFRLSKERWLHLDSPRHLFLFTPSTLAACLSAAGLQLERSSTLGMPSFWWAATLKEADRLGASEPPRDLRPSTAWRARVMSYISRALCIIRPEWGEFICARATKQRSG